MQKNKKIMNILTINFKNSKIIKEKIEFNVIKYQNV